MRAGSRVAVETVQQRQVYVNLLRLTRYQPQASPILRERPLRVLIHHLRCSIVAPYLASRLRVARPQRVSAMAIRPSTTVQVHALLRTEIATFQGCLAEGTVQVHILLRTAIATAQACLVEGNAPSLRRARLCRLGIQSLRRHTQW